MIWIVGATKDIAVNAAQMNARRKFICDVSGCEATPWQLQFSRHMSIPPFFYIETDDGINGAFITAHIHQVVELCSLQEVSSSKLIIANTCVLTNDILNLLIHRVEDLNRNAKLYLTKQEPYCKYLGMMPIQVASLTTAGNFGFQSSISERMLFKHRALGLLSAIDKSFDLSYPKLCA